MIELLAVIAIIAILASLLLPSLGAVNDRARTVKCASNLRQIAALGALYASDYEGALPPAYPANDEECSYQHYYADGIWSRAHIGMGILQAYEQKLPIADWDNWTGPAGDPTVGPWNKAFICPSDKNPQNAVNPNNLPPTSTRKAISYAFALQAWACLPHPGYSLDAAWGYWRHQSLPLSAIRNPSQTVLYVDGDKGPNNNNFVYFWNSTNSVVFGIVPDGSYGEMKWQGTGLILRHKQQTAFNAAFADGHAQTFAFPDYPPGLTRDWNLP